MTKAKRAIFSSGSFNHSVEMGIKDFVKLENAALAVFGVKKKIKLPKKIVKIKKKISKIVKKRINGKYKSQNVK